MPSSDASTRALPSLHEFFSPGGILARSPLPFEYRPGQYEMAKAVERALAERRHLIVEAGTGTGKTLAYLLPALRTGQRIIVSTGTKALQDQLFFRDVPFLETLLGELRVCYMKGRANYLCRRKLFALRDQPILSGLDEIDEYRQIAEWERITETGDRAELSALPESSALWHKLDARTDACLGSTCPDYRRCFITEMRRRALESDLIIVNHHLFFADTAVRLAAGNAPDAGILPESAAVIFDEAHELEEVASQYFGRSLSNLRFEDLARDTDVLLRGNSGATQIPALTQQLRERARLFFAALPMPADGRHPFTNREEFLESSGDLYLAVRSTLSLIEAELDRIADLDESPGLKNRAATLRADLEFMLESNASNMVFWLERRVGPSTPELQRSAPRSSASGRQEVSGHDFSRAIHGSDNRSGALAPAGRRSSSTYLQATPIDVSELLRDLVRAAVAAEVFIAEPIGRTQKLARKNIGLNFLPFARRVAFDPTGAAVDGIAAQSVRSHCDLVLRIAVQAVVADFVSNDDQLLGRVLVLGHVDESRGAIEKTEHALADDAAGFVMAKVKIVIAQGGSD